MLLIFSFCCLFWFIYFHSFLTWPDRTWFVLIFISYFVLLLAYDLIFSFCRLYFLLIFSIPLGLALYNQLYSPLTLSHMFIFFSHQSQSFYLFIFITILFFILFYFLLFCLFCFPLAFVFPYSCVRVPYQKIDFFL